MNKIQIFAILALSIGLLAITQSSGNTIEQTNLQKDPPKTVPYVNLTRYLGAWYEQASIPAYFELNCERTFANYSFNDDGSIRVDNECYRNGKISGGIGRAYPDPADTEHTNAKLKVKFPSAPVAGDYWIVRLDDSYSYVVVSSPKYNYLWIMYRSPVMAEQLYQTIVEDIKKDGFPV